MNNDTILKPSYPFPGGKGKIADAVWKRLGDVDNFADPFTGSMVMLLRRPTEHFKKRKYLIETVNDKNHFIANFWRAVREAPREVAMHADWPVTEADMHARHRWLMRSDESYGWRQQFINDPEHFDAKIAGWWVWGQCCWIGAGWCIDETRLPDGRPQLADAFDIGRGVNASPGDSSDQFGLHGKRPAFPDGGISRGVSGTRAEWLREWIERLSDRIRNTRVCYGHWSRICDSESTLTRLGTTGVFLDPPYPKVRGDNGKKSRSGALYHGDETQDLNQLRNEVLGWSIKWGNNQNIRIAVCGYEGDGYEILVKEHGWTEEKWEASGGYANQRRKGEKKSDNAMRERVWYSPGCLRAEETNLFSECE